ncbi:nuclease-related domain-containing protein [Psychrobacillus vulpis]|uniref:NERD domain-containing protein n=1 Tax=Psychrobacillus vulpis TaxID=2325572 RepID=A0A544TKN5_9BACI|nr:nuclease-related domain-containing protein [Psychrobacillus vulpis]TQR18003.1 NERD domain-containing protein [Psychrobacillus vulpis]
MAQLVKLQDYISRYQVDLKRYPTQFVRLKKQQWDRTKEEWENGTLESSWLEKEDEEEIPEKKSLFSKLFNRNKEEHSEKEVWVENELLEEEIIPEEFTTLHFQPNIVYKPQSIEELKRMYLDQLFHFQLKWASSTLREKSYVDPKFMRDTLLRNFTLRLPDNYFLFYYPILKLKKAPVELDILLILPTEIICVVALEARDLDAFIGSSDRFWLRKSGKDESKILSPLISLNRMESILMQIFKKEEIDLPVRKVVLSRNGYIDYPGTSFNTQFIDTRKYQEWFKSLASSPSPMKHMQFKAAQAILDLAQTTSYSRTGWELDGEEADE